MPEIRTVASYYDHPQYITALADSVRDTWRESKPDRLLMSFHGIPQAYADRGDPYPAHCAATADLLRRKLGLDEQAAGISYQSQFGRGEWLKPQTSATLNSWAEDGVTSVDVICPGFTIDSLETLEEIAIENRNAFLAAGGKSFRFIPALNDSEAHVRLLQQIVGENSR